MKRSTDRILTTHIGSLVRPKEVLQFMADLERGREVDTKALEETTVKAINDAVARQVEIGIDIPNDGEYWRRGFPRYINNRIEGMELRPPEDDPWANTNSSERPFFPDFFDQYDKFYRFLWMHPEVDIKDLPNRPGNFERFKVTGKVKYRGQDVLQKEMEVFRQALAPHKVADAFITATHPGRSRADSGYQDYYPTEEAYFEAVADVFHEEYKAITDAGFILQIDYPTLDRPSWFLASRPAAERAEIVRAAEFSVEMLNHALRGIPEEMVRLHYCWGSMNQPHTQDAPLREIVHLMLKVKSQGYSIEGANPRHEHEWQVWKDVKLPDGKILIPGLISHQTNVVEHPELVAWRIENYASVVGKENVIAGADCGFSQFWDSIRVHPSVQWAKLQSLCEGAAIASKKLWGR
jgi:5-methyltetrahydropteroyltriglutamate--homocysteine methyltransferase